MSFICDKLAPPSKIDVSRCFKLFFESITVQKTVVEVLKTWYFSYSAIWLAGQLGGLNAPAPPSATLLPSYFGQEPAKGPLLSMSQAVIHLSMFTCLAHSVEASH